MPSSPKPVKKSTNRQPRGPQGYGMDTSKGSVRVTSSNDTKGKKQVVVATGTNKKTVNNLVKTAVNSKSARVTGKKDKGYSFTGEMGNGNRIAVGKMGPGRQKVDVYRSEKGK